MSTQLPDLLYPAVVHYFAMHWGQLARVPRMSQILAQINISGHLGAAHTPELTRRRRATPEVDFCQQRARTFDGRGAFAADRVFVALLTVFGFVCRLSRRKSASRVKKWVCLLFWLEGEISEEPINFVVLRGTSQSHQQGLLFTTESYCKQEERMRAREKNVLIAITWLRPRFWTRRSGSKVDTRATLDPVQPRSTPDYCVYRGSRTLLPPRECIRAGPRRGSESPQVSDPCRYDCYTSRRYRSVNRLPGMAWSCVAL
ncbi:hypothetical protein RRG08_043663 [Elysia crispata]|uniref:Uncharacterized protein n=1 Tax=Elysia crispata TaxID=231223 RepID=A0AAE1DNJ5_9GAST|nr:hypothetical protein RRG08_043663 [Elysia crispata]